MPACPHPLAQLSGRLQRVPRHTPRGLHSSSTSSTSSSGTFSFFPSILPIRQPNTTTHWTPSTVGAMSHTLRLAFSLDVVKRYLLTFSFNPPNFGGQTPPLTGRLPPSHTPRLTLFLDVVKRCLLTFSLSATNSDGQPLDAFNRCHVTHPMACLLPRHRQAVPFSPSPSILPTSEAKHHHLWSAEANAAPPRLLPRCSQFWQPTPSSRLA